MLNRLMAYNEPRTRGHSTFPIHHNVPSCPFAILIDWKTQFCICVLHDVEFEFLVRRSHNKSVVEFLKQTLGVSAFMRSFHDHSEIIRNLGFCFRRFVTRD